MATASAGRKAPTPPSNDQRKPPPPSPPPRRQLFDELADDRKVIDVLREIRNACETTAWRSNDRMIELLDEVRKEAKQCRAILCRIEKKLEER